MIGFAAMGLPTYVAEPLYVEPFRDMYNVEWDTLIITVVICLVIIRVYT